MIAYTLRAEAGRALVERREAPQPVPGAGQILLRVRAAGLNRGELLAARGTDAKPGGAPKPAGGEAAGEVAALGAGVTGFAAGERVMGRMPGAFAEYALIDAREAVAVPKRLSWEQAAAVPLVFMVVHDMLIGQGRLRAGEWLLVLGVSSGVGVGALQAAKALGAKVIGTSGSAAKLERLAPLGLDLALKTRKDDFHDAVMAATGGKGANLAVNAIGGSVFAQCVRTLAFEGRLAMVGYLDGVHRSEIDLDALHSRRLTLFGVSNRLRNAEQRSATVRGFVADLLPAIADGRIEPLIDRVFGFDQLPLAIDRMESDVQVGKIVVRMS